MYTGQLDSVEYSNLQNISSYTQGFFGFYENFQNVILIIAMIKLHCHSIIGIRHCTLYDQ